jgi:hypothetical protein
MSFWTALSALAPVAPALSDARDIRTQRQQEEQEAQLREAQLTTQKLAAQEEQQRIEQGKAPIPIPGTEKYYDPAQGSWMQPSLVNGTFQSVKIPGQAPADELKAATKGLQDAFSSVGMQLPPSLIAELGYHIYGGVGSPNLTIGTGVPRPVQLAGPDGKPFDATFWGGHYYDEQGTEIPHPIPYVRPPTNPPINTEYVQVMGKDPSTWTLQEQQFIKGYGAYLKAQEALAGARGAAYNASRPVQVQDLNNPGNAIIMPAGQAEALSVPTTQSIPFRVQYATQSALNRYFTAGKGGENIRTLNTAVAHLALLRQLSQALGNGDVRLWNALGQSYARATGSPAPINFDMLRDSLAGEMARVFTGVGATEQEIAEITGPISNSNSPAQLSGAIDTAQAAMNSRLTALKQQYAAGKQGLPAFGGEGAGPAAGPATGPATPLAAPPAANPVDRFLLSVPGGNNGPR